MRASAHRLGFLSAVLGLTLVPLAQAVPVTINFTAHGVGVDGAAPVGIASGSVSGSFTYENSIANTGADPNTGIYIDALTNFNLVVGSLYNLVNVGPASIAITNDKLTGSIFSDRMVFGAFAVTNTVVGGPGSTPFDMGVNFGDLGTSPPSLFTSIDLPQTGAGWPSAAALDSAGEGTSLLSHFGVSFGVGGGISVVYYKFDSFTQAPASVPDSAPVAGLLALGLGAMAAGARCLRRA